MSATLRAECKEPTPVEDNRTLCYACRVMRKFILVLTIHFLFSACDGARDTCSGFAITGTSAQTSFSVPELMAQATAMGLTQTEAETLIYLEGITPNTRIEPGETMCIDGKPD